MAEMVFLRRALGACIVLCGLQLVAFDAAAQCTKDTDCKGDRVCQAGECMDPAPAEPRAGGIQVDTSVAQPPSDPKKPVYDPGLRSIISQRRIGRALLFSGIGALGFGLVFQAGWALEECWEVYDPDEREICELSSLGETFVIGGAVLGTIGLAGIITGAIMAGRAKRKLQDTVAWRFGPSLMAGRNGAGLQLQLTF